MQCLPNGRSWRVAVLDEPPRRQQAAKSQHTRFIYTDGSHKKEKNAPAGWAVVVLEAIRGGQRVAAVESGKVEIKETAHGYCGAKRHSNNTGELTALLKAVEREARAPAPEGGVTLRVDSLLAINVANGRWLARKLHSALARKPSCMSRTRDCGRHGHRGRSVLSMCERTRENPATR